MTLNQLSLSDIKVYKKQGVLRCLTEISLMRNVGLCATSTTDRRKESFPTVFSSALAKIAGYCWEKKIYINTISFIKIRVKLIVYQKLLEKHKCFQEETTWVWTKAWEQSKSRSWLHSRCWSCQDCDILVAITYICWTQFFHEPCSKNRSSLHKLLETLRNLLYE